MTTSNFTADQYAIIKKILLRDEGIRSMPYKCSSNCWTIGVGHLLPHGFDPRIEWTYAESISTLMNDIDTHWEAAQRMFGVDFLASLSFERKVGILSLIFNLGYNGLAGFHQTVPLIKERNWKQVGTNLLKSKWARDVDPRQIPGKGRDDRVIQMLTLSRFHKDYNLQG